LWGKHLQNSKVMSLDAVNQGANCRAFWKWKRERWSAVTFDFPAICFARNTMLNYNTYNINVTIPLQIVQVCNFIGHLIWKQYSPSSIAPHVSAISYMYTSYYNNYL
jgi:hypothetical protein